MTLGMISKGSMDEDGEVRAINRGAKNKKKGLMYREPLCGRASQFIGECGQSLWQTGSQKQRAPEGGNKRVKQAHS